MVGTSTNYGTVAAAAALCAILLASQWQSPLQFGVLLVSWMPIFLISSNDEIRRRFESTVGGFLLKIGENRLIQSAGLQKREALLPEHGFTIHYYEKPGAHPDSPTLLLCHGMTSEARNLAALIGALQKGLPGWRMIAPDAVGHGHDLERAKRLGVKNFPYPKPDELGEPVSELMDVLQIKECYAYGASMGGALVYFLQQKRPELIRKSILISPAVENVLDEQFIEDWATGRKNHFCFESRDDVRKFMHDLSCPQRKKHDPIPSFFLEAIWQIRREREPPGHFRILFQRLINERGKDPAWLGCTSDIAPEAPRLVLWPVDDFISNHEKGKKFFANSSPTKTIFRSLPDCGHLFHSDGKSVLLHAAPMMIDYLRQDHV